MEVSISPSLAAGNLLALGAEVKKLEQGGANAVHFDVMDGHFVPLLTLGVPIIEQLRDFTKMHLDVHIMVSNPDAVFQDYLTAGADTLSFHIEAAIHAHKICQKIKSENKKVGVALNPATHWHAIKYLLPILDQVTIMTVNPGYSRQHHITQMHEKIKELSEYCQTNVFKVRIQVDGGVNSSNITQLSKLGARDFVAGGAVMGHENYAQKIAELRSNANRGINV